MSIELITNSTSIKYLLLSEAYTTLHKINNKHNQREFYSMTVVSQLVGVIASKSHLP